jgi:hypothetical protein
VGGVTISSDVCESDRHHLGEEICMKDGTGTSQMQAEVLEIELKAFLKLDASQIYEEGAKNLKEKDVTIFPVSVGIER